MAKKMKQGFISTTTIKSINDLLHEREILRKTAKEITNDGVISFAYRHAFDDSTAQKIKNIAMESLKLSLIKNAEALNKLGVTLTKEE